MARVRIFRAECFSCPNEVRARKTQSPENSYESHLLPPEFKQNECHSVFCVIVVNITALEGTFYCPPGRKTRFYCPLGQKNRFYCPPGWKTSFSVPGGNFLEGYFFSDHGFHYTRQCSNVGNNDTKVFVIPLISLE